MLKYGKTYKHQFKNILTNISRVQVQWNAINILTKGRVIKVAAPLAGRNRVSQENPVYAKFRGL
jgi:hypothetical protein